MPSFNEGLSISLCEAQVNGLRCYTSDAVDKSSNISGNVEFLSLDGSPKEWAEYIYKSDNSRDNEILNKLPKEFDDNYCYEKVFNYFDKILEEKRNGR